MLIPDQVIDVLADKDFFESFYRYEPERRDFIDRAVSFVPRTWTTHRQGTWFTLAPPSVSVPSQGWKIHLSAVFANAVIVLSLAARCAVKFDVPFKVLLDRTVFGLVMSKRWDREASGKFVTLYPHSTEECRAMLTELARDTVGMQGPLILSDRRFGSSQVVHYRYGGFAERTTLTAEGSLTHMIIGRDGAPVEDLRKPYFVPPQGVVDPFQPEDADNDDESEVLLAGRFRVQRVVAQSSSGGVYLAIDNTTGAEVILKEARPHTNQTFRGSDAVWSLLKEARHLRNLEDLHLAPAPILLFRDWEHYFLAQEYIAWPTLRTDTSLNSLALLVAPTQQQAEDFVARFCTVFANVADAFGALHERGIIFGDVSHHNTLIDQATLTVRLIDFEGAQQVNVDEPSIIYTPGFASRELLAHAPAGMSDDVYGIGCLMLCAVMPFTRVHAVKADAYVGFLHDWAEKLGFPETLVKLIRSIVGAERGQCPDLASVRKTLADPHRVGPVRVRDIVLPASDLESHCADIERFTVASMTPERNDRLFPASPQVFRTHPAALGYGAAGVVRLLLRTESSAARTALDWIEMRAGNGDDLVPGYYFGAAGIADTMLQAGRHKSAYELMERAAVSPLLGTECDLYTGDAGWGLVCLRCFMDSGDEKFLDWAGAAMRRIASVAVRDASSAHWVCGSFVSTALGHGSSGIALFLLRYWQVTRDESALDLAKAAMEHCLATAIVTRDSGLSWRAREEEPTIVPYLRWGSAGVGAAILRFGTLLDMTRFEPVLDGAMTDCARRYTIFPGHGFGLAGLLEFWLDVAAVPALRTRAIQEADRVVEGIRLFAVKRGHGTAYPGDNLARLSCDLETGSAGVGLALLRRARGGAHTLLGSLMGEQDPTVSVSMADSTASTTKALV